MKTTEILRGLLDIIDGLESSTEPKTVAVIDPAAQEKAAIDQEYKDRANDDVARMNQIKDLLPNPCATKEFANEPEEKYATVDSVTVDAGGGPNAPKHPADIRTDATSMYPALQFRV